MSPRMFLPIALSRSVTSRLIFSMRQSYGSGLTSMAFYSSMAAMADMRLVRRLLIAALVADDLTVVGQATGRNKAGLSTKLGDLAQAVDDLRRHALAVAFRI